MSNNNAIIMEIIKYTHQIELNLFAMDTSAIK